MKKTSNRLHSLFATLAALILAAALAVPAFAVEGGFADLYYRVFDDAEVLTEDEDNELEDALEELSLRQSFDVTIATIESMQNYHFKNIESFFNISYDTLCKLQKPRSVATSCQDILMEYFREHEMLDAAVDGRMTILPPTARERRLTHAHRKEETTHAHFLAGAAGAGGGGGTAQPQPQPPRPNTPGACSFCPDAG